MSRFDGRDRALEGRRHRRRAAIPAPIPARGEPAAPLRASLAGLLLIALQAAGASAQVYLNEMTVRPAGSSASVELYNSAGGSTDISGWTIDSDLGTYTVPDGTVMPSGGYLTLDVGAIMYERGGVTSLIDIVKTPGGGRSLQDAVHYGQAGSAPLPPAGMSLARAPDASVGAPPPPSAAQDGLVWTIDPVTSFNAPNNLPQPMPGTRVVLNELKLGLVGGNDLFELYNPIPFAIPVDNWVLMNGDSLITLSGVVPANGFLVLATPDGFDLEEVELLYLFDQSGTRLDQLGFHDAPSLGPGWCLGRCPDGSPPFLGYDFVSSGGGLNFRALPCTIGWTNGPSCVAAVPEERTILLRWGQLKEVYR